MVPLIYSNVGEENVIKKVSGSQELRKHLEDMGFVPGTVVSLISMFDGNVIVSVKNVRIAISKEMAQKIYI
ncbi:MAG: FeoA family protein [Erysipelotrichia bacterium]|nr:FeoA family protein [Erysipelotrichia bacterium]